MASTFHNIGEVGSAPLSSVSSTPATWVVGRDHGVLLRSARTSFVKKLLSSSLYNGSSASFLSAAVPFRRVIWSELAGASTTNQAIFLSTCAAQSRIATGLGFRVQPCDRNARASIHITWTAFPRITVGSAVKAGRSLLAWEGPGPECNKSGSSSLYGH